jgi:hypothetical protein
MPRDTNRHTTHGHPSTQSSAHQVITVGTGHSPHYSSNHPRYSSNPHAMFTHPLQQPNVHGQPSTHQPGHYTTRPY